MRVAVKNFVDPRYLAMGLAVVAALLRDSPNWGTWVACLAGLPVAIYLAGGRKAEPVLIWILTMFWIAIAGQLVAEDLVSHALSKDREGIYILEAIYYSLAGMTVMALGMRLGNGWGMKRFARSARLRDAAVGNATFPLDRLIICYGASYLAAGIGSYLSAAIPPLAQAFVALSGIKFIFIYLIAVRVLDSGRGQYWLMLILLFEVASGMISYFSSYKEAIFVVMLALLSSRRKVALGYCVAGLLAVVLILWMSLVWSTVKGQFRNIFSSLSTQQKIEWIFDQYQNAQYIDYQRASSFLAGRVGYMHFFGAMIAREEAGILPHDGNYYLNAVGNIFMPRVLFPDKAVLDDTSKTEHLTGIYIGRLTSAGVGYAPEAYADFGFPGMLLPLCGIGFLLAAVARYFLTRPMPIQLGHAFAVATLFQQFAYAANIDKSFAALIIWLIEMSVIVKVGYPMIGPWLMGGRSPRRGRVTRAQPAE